MTGCTASSFSRCGCTASTFSIPIIIIITESVCISTVAGCEKNDTLIFNDGSEIGFRTILNYRVRLDTEILLTFF
jgi:hypothetical protein